MDFCPFSFNNCRIKIQDFPLVFIFTQSMNFLPELVRGKILTAWSSTIFVLLPLMIFNGEAVCCSMSRIFSMLSAKVLLFIFFTRRIVGIVGIVVVPSLVLVGRGDPNPNCPYQGAWCVYRDLSRTKWSNVLVFTSYLRVYLAITLYISNAVCQYYFTKVEHFLVGKIIVSLVVIKVYVKM